MSIDPEPKDSAAAPDLHKLAQDWITLWQSELAAIAADREAQESWQAMLALWAGVASAMLRTLPHERPERRARTAASPGTEAAAAAPDPRDAAIEHLTRRIGELEARLANVEHGNRGNGAGRARARRGRNAAGQRPDRGVEAERGTD